MNKSLREKIYQKIRDDITYGKFVPGERLVENRLAEEFKSSRSPVREALRQLESDELITFERNKGIVVSKLSIKQVDEIYTMRCLLESYATRLTAENITKGHVVYLRELQKRLEVAAKDVELREWLHNNALFHNFMCEHCGNSNLIQVLDKLKRRVHRYRYIAIRIPGQFESSIKYHAGILRACEESDGKLAEKYMKHHLEEIKNHLKSYLSEVTPNH